MELGPPLTPSRGQGFQWLPGLAALRLRARSLNSWDMGRHGSGICFERVFWGFRHGSSQLHPLSDVLPGCEISLRGSVSQPVH